MKSAAVFLAALSSILVLNAAEPRFVTLNPGIALGTTGATNIGGTNRLVIAANETAELVSFPKGINWESRIVFTTLSGPDPVLICGTVGTQPSRSMFWILWL